MKANWTIDNYGNATDGTGYLGTSAEVIDDVMQIDHSVPDSMGSYYTVTTSVPLPIVAELLRRAGYTVTKGEEVGNG